MDRIKPEVAVHLQVRPDRVPARQWLAHAEDNWLIVEFCLKRAKQAIPQNQGAAIIPVDIDFVLRMMHTVI